MTRLPGAESNRIWPAVKSLAQDRNLIVHGFWAVDDALDDRPVVLSHRFLESEDYVTGEYFDYRRFEFFQKRADHLLNMFRQFRTMLGGLTREERSAAKLILPKEEPKARKR